MAIRVQLEQAAQGGTRTLDARAANDRIAEKAERLRFVSRVPMLCECSAPTCRTIVMISVDDYRRIREEPESFLTTPGHHVDGAELHEATEKYAVFVLLEDRTGNGDCRSA